MFSSPLARRLAKEAGIDLSRISGTGPHGRIVMRDVEGAKDGKGLKAPGAAPSAGAAAPGGATFALPAASRAFALQWLSNFKENAGDPAGAIDAAESALGLIGDDVGPWQRAILHTQLFSLYEHVGDTASAARHAAEALPVLDRLGAVEDSVQIRALLASTALIEGRRDDAARMIDELEDLASGAMPGEIISIVLGRAQLALVDGDIGRTEVSALLGLNTDLRREYISDCEGGVKRWNKLLESAGLSQRLSLPHLISSSLSLPRRPR